MGTEESKFRLCCLVVQSATSCSYAIEDGLPDGGEVTSVLTARYRSCCAHVNFDVSIGINECDCAWRAGEKLKANAVAIKTLIGFEKKVPRTVPDEVGHKAAEDSSTSRATWKSNKKSGCYWRGRLIPLKLGFCESRQEREHHIVLLLLGTVGVLEPIRWRDFSKDKQTHQKLGEIIF